MRNSVRVAVRTRPTPNFNDKLFCIDEEHGTIDVTVPSRNDVSHFKFDKMLHNAPQERVFDDCVRDIITSVMEGYNGTVMVYGQTGAGKTFTMSGGPRNFELRGIIPRAISAIYEEVSNRPETAYTIRISYTEIYTEFMYDLLSSLPVGKQSGTELQIQEDAKGGLFVRGLTLRLGATEEEALNHFFEGDMNRAVAGHTMNAQSSRSHCIFSIYIEGKSRVESNDRIVTSKLHLVDLAGCERVKKTKSDGILLRESSYINKSLSFLEMVVVALGEKGRDHIPYRSSRLTHLLKDSIGGNCRTCMITNIWPEPQHMEETISTLRFSTRMMRVSNKAVVNVQIDPLSLLRKYEREIRSLKQELQMQNNLRGRTQVAYEAFSPDEKEEMKKTAQAFFEGGTELIEIVSLRQVNELMRTMRELYQEALAPKRDAESQQESAVSAQEPSDGQNGKQRSLRTAAGSSSGGSAGTKENVGAGATTLKAQSSPALGKSGPIRVGVEDTGAGGASLGIDPDQSMRESRQSMEKNDTPQQAQYEYTKTKQSLKDNSPARLPLLRAREGEAVDRKQAYFDFKQGEGKIYEDSFMQIRQELNEKRSAFTALATNITVYVDEMEALKEKLRLKQEEVEESSMLVPGREGQRVVDEEEFMLMKKLKETKNKIRAAMKERKNIKAALTQGEHEIARCKVELVNAFSAWYRDRSH
ncbi:putative kinesin motor domain-containing protein [Neospora caninum Liverpool]|uniref:Kinesin motor domain-containing protein,putative n=1 Tax=Neospora caninum (strain Liverpool) TaxID=572307 RepID=F0VHS2_NEOCL|nr:putative kinesin motor domain-containing protein [Neospora caninum Liverpool]CBZ53283.1 putative kinesin motor domain-containing protein [Neospora caninum Liverpool]CEL67269.1 TPA: kinesin motor domain-containing protein,putative [Neospora caninum Liverpool]|eukprot:XP_003883315.1 putative kinesin motor domain-containing protein [Neospora caninum Liverpool]